MVKSLLSKTLSNLVNEPFNNIEVALLVFFYVADNNFEKVSNITYMIISFLYLK